MISDFLGASPRFDETNFIAPSADVIGDVTLGPRASIWYNATLRGDVNFIRIGAESNIQDNSVVHVTHGSAPTRIGDRVTVGHGAIVHGCTIEDNVLIGMGAVVMDHAVVGTGSIVGARALVTSGMEIPPHSMVLGVPAKVVRRLSEAEIASIGDYADNYVRYSAIFMGKEVPEKNPFYGLEEEEGVGAHQQ